MGLTLITHFTQEGYRTLYEVLKPIQLERVCRVPYGRVEDSQRYAVDNLPYHFTVTSSKESLAKVMSQMNGFEFTPFTITIDGLDIMRGRNNSLVLYFRIRSSKEMDNLQMRLYEIVGNKDYLPQNNITHMTLCISKDHNKIFRLKKSIESIFQPFKLEIISLGLYEIWPAQLQTVFPLTR